MDAVLMTKLQMSRSGRALTRLTAVAAYEDASTESRVHEFCRNLLRRLGPEGDVVEQMWLFSELRLPQLRAVAADEAARADLIIVSARPAESLPDEVKSWIELWLKRKKSRPKVLLGLFDPPYRGVSSSLQAYLKEVAQRGGLEFLVQAEDMPSEL